MKADFAQHAAFEESADVFVNRGQRNRGYFLAHAGIDQFRAGMAVQRHDCVIDHPPLVRSSEAMPAAESAKVAITYHLIIIIVRYLLAFSKG